MVLVKELDQITKHNEELKVCFSLSFYKTYAYSSPFYASGLFIMLL